MDLLEKYFTIKLDNYQDEGFTDRSLMIMAEFKARGLYSREDIANYEGDVELAKKENRFWQAHLLELIEKKLEERGRCSRCNGWLTSQYFDEITKNKSQGGIKGGSSTSEKKVKASKANAARLNASLTPEQRAEIQKKRIATMAKKREERERLKQLMKEGK